MQTFKDNFQNSLQKIRKSQQILYTNIIKIGPIVDLIISKKSGLVIEPHEPLYSGGNELSPT